MGSPQEVQKQLTPIGKVDLAVNLNKEGSWPIFWLIRRQVREAIAGRYGDKAQEVLEKPFQAIRFNEDLRAKGITAAVLIGTGSHHWICNVREDDIDYPLKIEFRPVGDTSSLIEIKFRTPPSVSPPSTDQRKVRQIFSHREHPEDFGIISTHLSADVVELPVTAAVEPPSSCIAVFLTPALAQKMGDSGRPPQFLLVTAPQVP